MKNSILQNSVESRRKSEKNSIVSGIGCGRTPSHACARDNPKLQIPSSNIQRKSRHQTQKLNISHEALELARSEEHTSELQSPCNLVCRLLLEKKNII